MSEAMKIPVTLIGGYLGAGKTTLVNHLLRNAAPKRLAVLVNEFGALPIDADLIEAQDGDIISLSGGCVCCSYGNDLISAIMDVAALEPPPDHILLEASGVALPGAIASSLTLLSTVTLDGIAILADSETVLARSSDKYMGDTIMRQMKDADLVFLNKADLVSTGQLEKTKDWLAGAARNAVVIETQYAQAPLSVVLQDFDRDSITDGPRVPHNTSAFETVKLAADEPVNPHRFAQNLIDSTPGIVRAKGFVRDQDGALKTVQIVGKRIDISDAPAGVSCGLVVISIKS